MKTSTAIALAAYKLPDGSRVKGRQNLAALLECSYIVTYRWKPDLPKHRENQLRLLKPGWFRPAVIAEIEGTDRPKVGHLVPDASTD